jgi:replicative DNA helicase
MFLLLPSQLSRAVETRGSSKDLYYQIYVNLGRLSKMPILFLLYRPEYYKIDEWDDDEASPTAGQAEIMIAKHRNGSMKTFD